MAKLATPVFTKTKIREIDNLRSGIYSHSINTCNECNVIFVPSPNFCVYVHLCKQKPILHLNQHPIKNVKMINHVYGDSCMSVSRDLINRKKKWPWYKIDARNGKSVIKLENIAILRPLTFR